METICRIETDPEKWKIRNTDMHLEKEFGGERLLQISFGSLENNGIFEMKMYMRPSVYKKLLEKEYTVATESNWKHRLVLIDKENKKVEPVGAFVY